MPSIISRLGVNSDKWFDHIKTFGKRYSMCVGSVDNIVNFAESFDRQWCKGVGSVKKVCRKGIIAPPVFRCH